MSQKNLRFLVDVGVSKKVEVWLLENDYDIKAVRDVNPKMKDIEVLKLATDEHRMVITMDKDFGELIYNSGQPHARVLLLRLGSAKAKEKVMIVEKILSAYGDRLVNHFCVFQNGKLRIKK